MTKVNVSTMFLSFFSYWMKFFDWAKSVLTWFVRFLASTGLSLKESVRVVSLSRASTWRFRCWKSYKQKSVARQQECLNFFSPGPVTGPNRPKKPHFGHFGGLRPVFGSSACTGPFRPVETLSVNHPWIESNVHRRIESKVQCQMLNATRSVLRLGLACSQVKKGVRLYGQYDATLQSSTTLQRETCSWAILDSPLSQSEVNIFLWQIM